MLERPTIPVLPLLAATCLMFAAQHAQAATVSCSGVPDWNATTIYNPGDKIVFKGSLYQAAIQIWNTPPDHCPACGWYTQLGTCGTGGAGQPPAVSITAPASGASFACGATVNVAASASDPDGTVSTVDFLDGDFAFSTDNAAPFSTSWVPTSSGTHQIKARATDNAGNVTTSAAVSVTIGTCNTGGGLPARLLVGYWHNFDNGSGFIKLRDVSPD